jgi:hypothetical protein
MVAVVFVLGFRRRRLLLYYGATARAIVNLLVCINNFDEDQYALNQQEMPRQYGKHLNGITFLLCLIVG